MMTAMLTVRNIIAGRDIYDVWKVNQDAEYIKEVIPAQTAEWCQKVFRGISYVHFFAGFSFLLAFYYALFDPIDPNELRVSIRLGNFQPASQCIRKK